MEGRRELSKGGDGQSNMSGMIKDNTVDWRGRPSNPIKHGGMRAAAFVLGMLSLSLPLSISLGLLFPLFVAFLFIVFYFDGTYDLF